MYIMILYILLLIEFQSAACKSYRTYVSQRCNLHITYVSVCMYVCLLSIYVGIWYVYTYTYTYMYHIMYVSIHYTCLYVYIHIILVVSFIY